MSATERPPLLFFSLREGADNSPLSPQTPPTEKGAPKTGDQPPLILLPLEEIRPDNDCDLILICRHRNLMAGGLPSCGSSQFDND